MNTRGEFYREEPGTARGRGRVSGREADTRAEPERPAVTPREKKRQRDAEARRFVEAMVRAVGNPEDVGTQVSQRIEQIRRRIDAAAGFDQKLQDEYEFLKSQQEALAARPRLEVVAPRRTEAPVRTEPTKPIAPISFVDRMRAGWTSFKERLFPAAKAPEKPTGTTAYEQTWTPARKAQRENDREEEMSAVQERAVETLQTKLSREQARLKDVTGILTRNRKEPMPAGTRAKYVAEVQTLQTDIKDTQRLLRIAEASRDRQKRIRKAG